MTLRLPDLLVWLGLFALFALGLAVAAPLTGETDLPAAPLGPTLGDPPPQPVVASEVEIAFADESVAWDWTNICEDGLSRFLLEQDYPLRQLTVILVDADPALPLGVVYPSPAEPDALVFTGCQDTQDGLACRVAVEAGRPGSSLDTAVTVTLAYGAHERFRPRSHEAWDARSGWDWSLFHPMLIQEGTVWTSTCVEMKSH
jgi:hypothetical protein